MKDSVDLIWQYQSNPNVTSYILALYTSTCLEDSSPISVELFDSSTMAESWIGNYTSYLPNLL
jgi:hypothetical protein